VAAAAVQRFARAAAMIRSADFTTPMKAAKIGTANGIAPKISVSIREATSSPSAGMNGGPRRR